MLETPTVDVVAQHEELSTVPVKERDVLLKILEEDVVLYGEGLVSTYNQCC